MMNTPMIRNLLLVLAASGAVLIANGCRESSQQRAATSSTVPDEMDRLMDEIRIPTQEEADAAAARQISAENADEEFRRLEREILEDEG
jgi:hypothetical protein